MSILLAFTLTVTVVLAARFGFDHRLPGWAVLALYFASYGGLEVLRRRRARRRLSPETAPDRPAMPVSGPIGRIGAAGLVAVWTLTGLLSLLNPRQLVEIVRQLLGNQVLARREKQLGDGRGYRVRGRYRLPFRGEWLVYNGGTTPDTSHSWDVLGQRYALDFVKADAAYRRHRGRGTHPGDYHCYGEEIVAAADGHVVATEARVGTSPLVGWGICDFTARSFLGNHVLVDHGNGEFGLYAHLVPGSVTVRPGQSVRQGQTLGRCGHTGHSSEPHLHFHLQDSADLFRGMGLPVRFHDLKVNGSSVDAVHLTAGQRVRPIERALDRRESSPAASRVRA